MPMLGEPKKKSCCDTQKINLHFYTDDDGYMYGAVTKKTVSILVLNY